MADRPSQPCVLLSGTYWRAGVCLKGRSRLAQYGGVGSHRMDFRSTVAIASRDRDAEIEALFDAFERVHPETGPVMGFTTAGTSAATVEAASAVDVTFAFEASGWHDAFARALEFFGEAFEASSLPADLPIVSVLLEAASSE